MTPRLRFGIAFAVFAIAISIWGIIAFTEGFILLAKLFAAFTPLVMFMMAVLALLRYGISYVASKLQSMADRNLV